MVWLLVLMEALSRSVALDEVVGDVEVLALICHGTYPRRWRHVHVHLEAQVQMGETPLCLSPAAEARRDL